VKIPIFNTPIMEKVKYLEAKSRVDDRRIAELEGDVSFYRCCALSGEIPDDLSSPSSVALQAKTLKERE
jgi:hypothetical protein